MNAGGVNVAWARRVFLGPSRVDSATARWLERVPGDAFVQLTVEARGLVDDVIR